MIEVLEILHLGIQCPLSIEAKNMGFSIMEVISSSLLGHQVGIRTVIIWSCKINISSWSWKQVLGPPTRCDDTNLCSEGGEAND